MTNTICQGDIPTEFGDDDIPIMYDTEEAAQKEMIADFVEQLQQFLDGDRLFEHTNTTLQDWVEPVEVVVDDGRWWCSSSSSRYSYPY